MATGCTARSPTRAGPPRGPPGAPPSRRPASRWPPCSGSGPARSSSPRGGPRPPTPPVGGDPGRPAAVLAPPSSTRGREAAARLAPVPSWRSTATGASRSSGLAAPWQGPCAAVPGQLPVGQPRGRHGPTGGRGGRGLPAGRRPLHVDAAMARPRALDLDELGADYVSVSAHKLGGPPGTGALVLRRGTAGEPWWSAGEQERARRAGMENVLGIVGFGVAAGALAAEGGRPTGRRGGGRPVPHRAGWWRSHWGWRGWRWSGTPTPTAGCPTWSAWGWRASRPNRCCSASTGPASPRTRVRPARLSP